MQATTDLKELSHQVATKDQDANSKEAKLNCTSTYLLKTPQKRKPNILKRHTTTKLAPTGKPFKTQAEIAKPITLRIDKLNTPVKQKEIKVLPQPVKFITLKSFSKLLMSSSSGERINVDTETVKLMIPKKCNGFVLNLDSMKSKDVEQCEFNTTVTEMTQERIPGQLDMVQNLQVKEKEYADQVRVERKLLCDTHKGISVSDLGFIQTDDSEFNNVEYNLPEVDVAEVEAPDFPDVRIPEVKYRIYERTVKDILKKLNHDLTAEERANSKDEEASTSHETSQEQSKVLKTYSKTKSTVRATTPPRLAPSPVNILKDMPEFTVLSIRPLTTQAMLPVTPKDMPTGLSEIAIPLFNRPTVDIESVKAVHKYINDTIDAATSHKLPHAEAEKIKSLIKSYHEQYQKMKNDMRKQQKQLYRFKRRIIALKKRLSDYKVNFKSQAFEKITKDMTEDAKMIMKMQVVHHKKKPGGRRFNLKEKLFSLALYKLSRQAYRYMSTILPLPTRSTLNKFLNDLHTNLLFKDCTTDIISHHVKDGPGTDFIAHKEENGAAITNNSQQNDETVAAVAAITGESENQNSDRCTENNKSDSDQIEYVANQVTYPDVEAYTDEGYTQGYNTNGNGYINEIVLTQYIDQTNDQTPKVLRIPSNYGTISIGYSEYTQKLHQQVSLDDLSTSKEKKENLLNLNQVNAVANATLKKPKRYISGLTEEKIQKIDFILSKLMTPDQLKHLYPKPKKKKSKKTGVVAKKTIKKPNVQRNGVAKRALGMKKDTSNIMKRKRNFKTITPALSNEVLTNQISAYHCDIPEGVSINDPYVTNTYNINNVCVRGTAPKYKLNIPQNIQNYVQQARTNIGVVDQTMERFSRPVQVLANEYIGNLNAVDIAMKLRRNFEKYPTKGLKSNTNLDALPSATTKIGDVAHSSGRYSNLGQVTANEDINDSNAVDTVTKLRGNLEKYSPGATQNNSSYIDGLSMVHQPSESVKILSNVDFKEIQKAGKRKNTICNLDKEPVEVKRKTKLIIDESKFPEHTSRKYFSPELFVLGTRDVRTTNEVINSQVNTSKSENNHSYETEEPVRVKGFDMPDLNVGFNSSLDKKNRKKIGFKRLPTNPY